MKKFAFLTILALIALMIPAAGAASLAFLPFMANPGNMDDLDKMAADYMNFEGAYNGINDDMMDFGGAASFLNTHGAGREFVVTLVNANAAVRYAYLLPGIEYAPGQTAVNGFPLDAAFNDKNGDAGLTGSGGPTTLKKFFSYISHKPIQCYKIRVESTTTTQLSQQITIRPQSPFRTLPDYVINLSSFQNEDTYRDKIVTIETPGLVLSNDTQIEIPVVGSSTVTITFFCGAIMNPSYTLQNRISKAAESNPASPANTKNFQMLNPNQRSA